MLDRLITRRPRRGRCQRRLARTVRLLELDSLRTRTRLTAMAMIKQQQMRRLIKRRRLPKMSAPLPAASCSCSLVTRERVDRAEPGGVSPWKSIYTYSSMPRLKRRAWREGATLPDQAASNLRQQGYEAIAQRSPTELSSSNISVLATSLLIGAILTSWIEKGDDRPLM